ncbi:MAG: hypothetical protein Q9217_000123 [Psora testacea]
MSASAWQALRAICSPVRPLACPYVASRRLPYLRSTLRTTLTHRREDDPTKTPSASSNPIVETPTNLEHSVVEQQKSAGGPDDPPEKPPRPKDTGYYGSASKRAGRNVRRVKELPQVSIPSWFFDRNAITWEDLVGRQKEAGEDAALDSTKGNTRTREASDNTSRLESEQLSVNSSALPAEGSVNRYLAQHLKIDQHVLEEVISLVHAGLRIPDPNYADAVSSIKPHVVLFCPKGGASSYLDGLVQDIARTSKTDFLRLTPQDIAEIGGDYIEEPWSFQSGNLSSLGYDAAQVRDIQPSPPSEESAEQNVYEEDEENNEGEEAEEGEEQNHQAPRSTFSPRQGVYNMSVVPAFVGTFSSIRDIFKTIKSPDSNTPAGLEQPSKLTNGKSIIQMKDNTPDMKMSLLVESLLNVPELKRVTRHQTDGAPEGISEDNSSKNHSATEDTTSSESTKKINEAQRGSDGLIVLVEDYPFINMTANGAKFLDKLHDVVESRRREGQAVLIVGTASSRKTLPSGEKSAIDDAQTQPANGPIRNIVVPVKEEMDGVMSVEWKRKIRETNLRHLRDMLRRIAPVQEQVAPVIYDWDLSIESKWAFIGGLERSVWPLDKVNRTATIALGQLEKATPMGAQTIERAIEIIDASDVSKYGWLRKDKERKSKVMDSVRLPFEEGSPEDSESKMRRLRKKCNSYEKKLLNGVVDAKNIRTTFADVQAPPETIDALKTLTSLSLVRPDAFTYGVLATDRIPGLLLYGPPGTGKTLLAKAVAKESGATVLEVSGSDVYDMYVGEGEKNVKAIFTLAKKLSPCVVFIDEADAILGTRSSGHSRTSHRELINQFLREWDGMTDTSAFIMVATNRPFDLDEASLRRLPRRLLVDLPLEKDREAILKIHLKDEVLDPGVSVAHLASQTPFYSGSDLKNLCVAAALACVREEFDTAIAHNKDAPDDKYQYAAKRTLHLGNFTKAMEEISASISDDMSSLSAIRKFDEKYGDRRGRRKKLGGYGFKTVDDAEKLGSDAARVRNQT